MNVEAGTGGHFCAPSSWQASGMWPAGMCYMSAEKPSLCRNSFTKERRGIQPWEHTVLLPTHPTHMSLLLLSGGGAREEKVGQEVFHAILFSQARSSLGKWEVAGLQEGQCVDTATLFCHANKEQGWLKRYTHGVHCHAY